MGCSKACKLFGAYRTVISVKDAAVLIHSTIGCSWGTSNFHINSMQQDIRQASSAIYEEDVVYGGEKVLIKSIEHMQDLYDYSVLFILSGCTAEIMGDDLEGIIRGLSSSKPLIPISSGGFKGDMYSGINDSIKKLIDIVEIRDKIKNSINIVGILSDDFKSYADVQYIRNIIGEEIVINSIIPYDNYHNILNSAKSELNVIFKGFEEVGIYMEKRLGIPYIIVDYPYGFEGTKKFIKEIYCRLGINMSKFIEDQEKKAIKSLEKIYLYVQKLYGMPVAVKGDRFKGNSLKNFLQSELGMNVYYFDENISDFDDSVKKTNSVIVFGSSYERGIASELSIPLIRYKYPVFDLISVNSCGYVGYEGVVNFIENIINSIITIDYRRGSMFSINDV